MCCNGLYEGQGLAWRLKVTRLSAVRWVGRIRNPDTDWLIASGKRHRNLASCFLSPPTTAISFLISPFRNWRCWWWSNQHLTRQPAVLGGLGRDERSCAPRWGVAVTLVDPSGGLSQHLHDFPFCPGNAPCSQSAMGKLERQSRLKWCAEQRSTELYSTKKQEKPSFLCAFRSWVASFPCLSRYSELVS